MNESNMDVEEAIMVLSKCNPKLKLIVCVGKDGEIKAYEDVEILLSYGHPSQLAIWAKKEIKQ